MAEPTARVHRRASGHRAESGRVRVPLADAPLIATEDKAFSSKVRWAGLIYAAVLTAAVVAASFAVPPTRDGYLRLWVLAAAPFTTPALWLCWLVTQRSPSAHRPFWIRWMI